MFCIRVSQTDLFLIKYSVLDLLPKPNWLLWFKPRPARLLCYTNFSNSHLSEAGIG